MNAREELTAMFAPFFSGTVLEEAVDEAYALMLNEAADAIDASSETCKCDDCEVSRLNAAKLRAMATAPAAVPVPDETAGDETGEAPHRFEREYQGESDAKRRLARCKHCHGSRTDDVHTEAGDR